LNRTLKFASLAMSFAFLAATTAAHAASITFSLSSPTTSFAGGTETLTYDGTINALTDVYLNGDSLNVQSPLTGDDTDFYINVPQFLSAGGMVSTDLFTVTAPVGTDFGSYPGSFVLLGGDSADALDTLATAEFPVAATPEPSSLVLLVSGTLVMGEVVRRRGIKRA
jgi:hypothetical protein